MIRCNYKNGSNQVMIIFTLPVDGFDGALAVVGDFNGWDPTSSPMRKRNGNWTGSAAVETGRRYRFRYLRSDGSWLNDEAADAYEMGDLGADNSIVDLSDAALIGGPGAR